MGIYDWIKSMDVSVLDDFKSNPGSTVSITFVVPEEFADMIIRNFSNQIRKINLSVDKIPGIKRGDQFQKLFLEFEACGEVLEKYKQDMHIKRSKTIDNFIDVQSDEITMDMIYHLIP